jgi:hypothetical protein
MKVLSLLQPWASLVVLGHKKIETRSWETSFRGEILIHASAKALKYDNQSGIPETCFQEMCNIENFVQNYKENCPLGAIIGKVFIEHVLPTDKVIEGHHFFKGSSMKWDFTKKEIAFGDYSPGRKAWLLRNPIAFPKPIPAKGSLSIWNYEFEGQDQSHIMQCKNCGYAACSDAFPIDKNNIDTDEEDWDTWCPKCEERDLKLINEDFPY